MLLRSTALLCPGGFPSLSRSLLPSQPSLLRVPAQHGNLLPVSVVTHKYTHNIHRTPLVTKSSFNNPCRDISRTLDPSAGSSPNLQPPVRYQGSLAMRVVESSPTGIQPYLKLARLDKPVGKDLFQLLNQSKCIFLNYCLKENSFYLFVPVKIIF